MMDSSSLCFIKHSLSALALSLFLNAYSWYCYSFSFTFLVLLLASSFPFILSKIKQLQQADTTNKIASVNKAIQKDYVCSLDQTPEREEISSAFSDSSVASDAAGGVPSVCSDCSVSDDEPSPNNVSQLKDCSESFLSDEDDNLIEINLPNGHYIGSEEPVSLLGKIGEDFLPEFSPEAVFRQHGLMEFLSDINEEDNLIEIDINIGSIKCSRLGIKA